MLSIKSFTFGLFQTNTYVVSDEQGNVLLIDPACYTEDEKQQLLNYVNRQSSNRPLTIVATHGHLDHLWGAAWASKQWNMPVYIPSADIPMAEKMQLQYNMFDIPLTAEPFPIEPLQSAMTNHQSPLSNFQLLATPGHTPGAICIYFPEEKTLFSGDTLFRMGFGRTDLPGGNYYQLIQSLRTLFALPPDTKVFPGHGEPTTIGQESGHSPYL